MNLLLLRPRSLFLVALAFAFALPVRATEAKSFEDADRERANTARKLAAEKATHISVDFPGGSIAQFIKSLPASTNGSFNIIGEQADLTMALPPFSIRDASPMVLASALS